MIEVVIRTDASNHIGTGHVIRCLTLADELRRRGARCRFIHRAHPGHMTEAIRARGYDVFELKTPLIHRDATADGDYSSWLGVSVEDDAEETLVALKGVSPVWLIVDHYALDHIWEDMLRPHVAHLAVIDDLANRVHNADLLLDQNYSVEGESRYSNLLPLQARCLTGPGNALLDPVYADYRKRLKPRTEALKRVLIFFGGTDPNNLTGMAIEALSAPSFHDLVLDVIVGTNNPHRDTLETQARARGRVTLYGPRPHLADLLAAADLALGAGGTTTWERCCLGLPSLVVSIADNQRPSCETLAKDELIAYAGHWDEMSVEKLRLSMEALIMDPERMQKMASAGRELVDGRGVGHFVDHLFAISNSSTL